MEAENGKDGMPDFYRRHGYTVVGVLPDIPAGHEKYLLMKELKGETEP